MRRKPLGAIGAVLLFTFIVLAVLAPRLATHDPDLNNYRARVQPPSAEHWFGTDNFGRDIYSRVIYGARISMYVGILATVLGTSIGAAAGLLSGFLGGRIDQFMQRVADVMFTIPGLVLAMAIVTMLGPSMFNVILAIAIPRIPDTNRVIRSAVFSVKESLFVDAAHAIGCANWRIMLQHILPNVMAPYIVIASAGLSWGHSRRGLSELSGYGGTAAGAILGPDAVGRRHAVFRDGHLDGDFPGHLHQCCSVWGKPLRRCAARRARPQIARGLGKDFCHGEGKPFQDL